MIMTEDSFCKNKGYTDHMIGEEMANIRLLQEEGTTVVWVNDCFKILKKVGHMSNMFLHFYS